ncbi:hypothetical protein BDV96DRAFT_159500 [Lophiotrema nucula]|uniref:Uncharacterized protein n=1 Tax=Lophiotrema nucula TaxID=690887 RepID=A0A6A5Z0I5_9PLEO|nr:hypothetical protein BDV96DRAFT_159500 [Lophiotrema nucula]
MLRRVDVCHREIQPVWIFSRFYPYPLSSFPRKLVAVKVCQSSQSFSSFEDFRRSIQSPFIIYPTITSLFLERPSLPNLRILTFKKEILILFRGIAYFSIPTRWNLDRAMKSVEVYVWTWVLSEIRCMLHSQSTPTSSDRFSERNATARIQT